LYVDIFIFVFHIIIANFGENSKSLAAFAFQKDAINFPCVKILARRSACALFAVQKSVPALASATLSSMQKQPNPLLFYLYFRVKIFAHGKSS
jgi:hypothetical protein